MPISCTKQPPLLNNCRMVNSYQTSRANKTYILYVTSTIQCRDCSVVIHAICVKLWHIISLFICGIFSFKSAENSSQECSLFALPAATTTFLKRPIHSRSWTLLEVWSNVVHRQSWSTPTWRRKHRLSDQWPGHDHPGRKPTWHAVPEQCIVVESSAQGKELLPSLLHISAGAYTWAQQTSQWSACFVMGSQWVHMQSQQHISEF